MDDGDDFDALGLATLQNSGKILMVAGFWITSMGLDGSVFFSIEDFRGGFWAWIATMILMIFKLKTPWGFG